MTLPPHSAPETEAAAPGNIQTADQPQSQQRRSILRAAAVGGAGLLSTRLATAQVDGPPQGQPANRDHQPSFDAAAQSTTADIIVQTLLAWDVDHVFGMVGDGINPIIEALAMQQDKIRFIGVRHEEAAAFMASGWAKQRAVWASASRTTGPGAVHLMNGLYDAAFRWRAGPRHHRTDLPRSARHAVSAERRYDRADEGCRALQRRRHRPAARAPRGDIACRSALGDRAGRASGHPQGRPGDASCRRQGLDGEPRPAHIDCMVPARVHAVARRTAGRGRRASTRAGASRSSPARGRSARRRNSSRSPPAGTRRSPRRCWARPCCPMIRLFDRWHRPSRHRRLPKGDAADATRC